MGVLDKIKGYYASMETSNDTSGDYLQLEESTFNDLKTRKKIREDITFKDLKTRPEEYDEVSDAYIKDLKTTHKIPTDKEAALWSWRPGWYKTYEGKVENIPEDKKGVMGKSGRQVMEERKKNLNEHLKSTGEELLSLLNPFAKEASAAEAPKLKLTGDMGYLDQFINPQPKEVKEAKPLKLTGDMSYLDQFITPKAGEIAPVTKPTSIAQETVVETGKRILNSPLLQSMKRGKITPGMAINPVGSLIQLDLPELFKAGARWPKSLMSMSQAVQKGEDVGLAFQKAMLDLDKRDTTEIAHELGEYMYGNVSTNMWVEALKQLPFATLGEVSKIFTDPALGLTFSALGVAAKDPSVAKFLGKSFKAPKWVDAVIDRTVQFSHKPLATLAKSVKENRINAIVDTLNNSVGPKIAENYREIYKTEPTPNDIKGIIKAELVKKGIYGKTIPEVQSALIKAKGIKPGLNEVKGEMQKVIGKPGEAPIKTEIPPSKPVAPIPAKPVPTAVSAPIVQPAKDLQGKQGIVEAPTAAEAVKQGMGNEFPEIVKNSSIFEQFHSALKEMSNIAIANKTSKGIKRADDSVIRQFVERFKDDVLGRVNPKPGEEYSKSNTALKSLIRDALKSLDKHGVDYEQSISTGSLSKYTDDWASLMKKTASKTFPEIRMIKEGIDKFDNSPYVDIAFVGEHSTEDIRGLVNETFPNKGIGSGFNIPENDNWGDTTISISGITKQQFLSEYEAAKGLEPINKEIDEFTGEKVETDRDSLAKEYAGMLGQELVPWHKKFVSQVIDKDTKGLLDVLAQGRGRNVASKKMFSKITGLKLPDTVSGIEDVIYQYTGAERPKPIEKPEVKKLGKEEVIQKLREGRDAKTLDTKVNYGGDYGIITRREFVKKSLEGGAEAKAITFDDEKAVTRLIEERRDLGRNGMQNINAKRIEELNKKIESGVKKTEYQMKKGSGYYPITKAEYDYANSLKQEKPPSPTTPKPAIVEPGASQEGKIAKEKVEEYIPDVNLLDKKMAYWSHQGTSFSPEKRGEQEITGFGEELKSIYDALKPLAKSLEAQKILLDEMKSLEKTLASKKNALLRRHTGLYSSMVAGPSNFPVERMRKKNDAYQAAESEYYEFQKRARNAIAKKLNIIDIQEQGGDIEVIKKKIADKEKLQEKMKQANAIIRKNISDEEKVKELTPIVGEKNASELLKPDFGGRKGFAPYQLQSNLGDISRLKERMATFESRDARTSDEIKFEGGTVVKNSNNDRIQIFYDGKPSDDIIGKLKSKGFHWSPSSKAWQRQWTQVAEYATENIIGKTITTPKKPLGESGKVAIPPTLTKIADIVSTPEAREGLYQKIFNRFQSIENTVDKAKKLGAEIKPGEDAGLSATRYLSIANQADVTLRKGTYEITPEGKVNVTGEGLQPILDTYDSTSIEKNPSVREKDLKDYLIAQRTIEDLQRPKSEWNQENIATPEQVAIQQSKLSELKNKYGDLNTFENTANRIYDYQKRVLELLVKSGNISQEMFDGILAKNLHYVPFDRIIPEETIGGVPTMRNRFSGARSPVKKIKGSELEIHDPIESMIKNTYRIMNVAARNKVFKDIYSLKDIKELGITPAKIQMRPVNVTEKETGTEDITIFRPSQFKPKGNVLEGYVDGDRKYLEVSENLYKAMTGLDETSSSVLVKILSKPAQWLRVGATITPEFMLRNPIRDQWTALIQTNIGFKPFIDTIGAIADITKQTEVYDEWIRSGGSYAGFVELSRPNLKNLVKTLRKQPDLLKKLNIVHGLQSMSQLFEQATRVGVFKAGLKKGLSEVEAAKVSRESTLDFSRRGSATRDINSMTAFFNAGLQGLDKSIRTATKDPKGFVLKALITITIPSLLLYLKNRKEDDYKEIPRWQKDLFWMTKINGVWFRIPKPFSYGQIFGSLPERFLEYADSKNTGAFKDFGESLYNSLSPISGDPISGIMPTAIKPLLENQVNWSFFREMPIVTEGKQRLIPSEQYSKYDTETAKMLGRLTNVSPSKIENLISGYFGGSGRYVMQGGDLILKAIDRGTGTTRPERRPIELADIPLIKGFVTRENLSESINTFYDNKEKIEKLHNTYKMYRKEGQDDRAKKFLDNNPEIRKYPSFQEAYKKIKNINEEIDKVVANARLSRSQKREKLRLLNDKRIKAARIVNALIK